MAKNKISTSTELMDNYIQAEVISPQKKFRAVQTEHGLALLFSIGTDGVFYLIEQKTGHETGWGKIDLSSSLSKIHENGKVIAKTFAVAQNVKTQKIDIALAITVDKEDFLYLSLGHDDKAGSIDADSINWVPVAHDDPNHKGIKLDITNVFIAESRSEEYIVADISQSTFKVDPTDYLSRYYIDLSADQKWNPMTIGGELEEGASSCLGRVKGDRVDGMYTLGTINKTKELLYAPLYNPFNRKAPVTIRSLNMPEGASALAVSDAGDYATDLFVAGTKGLYYFASDNQENDSSGTLIVSSDLMNGATSLYAIAANNTVTVWGLNGRTDNIFYTTCPVSDLNKPTSWTVPLPIMAGVEQVAPYINRGNSANTFFAHTGTGDMTIGVKSPKTTIWNHRNVALPPISTKQKATKFSSYTTRVQVTDENDQPVSGAKVTISSDSDTSVYINHLYHIIGSTPIEVATDKLGTITIVEAVATLSGAKLHIALADGTTSSINPMDKPSANATKLQSTSDLSDAVIKYQNGDTKKLVKSGIKTDTLKAVASANTNLTKAYNHLNTPKVHALGMVRDTAALNALDENSIWVEAGDLFSWLADEIEHIGKVVWDDMKKAYTFVVEIAGEIYSAVLDCVEAVTSAIQTVFNAIIDAIKDLIDFLKFLFELDDIARTKAVIENIAKLYLQNEVDQIEVYKSEFNNMISGAEKAINNWAGRGELSGLGSAGTTPVNKSSKPGSDNSAPGSLLNHHLQNNAQNSSFNSKPPTPPKPTDPVSILIGAFEEEWGVLGDAIDAISELAANIDKMSAEELVKNIIAIIADTTLESVKVVVDALLDLVYAMAELALGVFETKIHIPVVSDILEDLGVPEFSFLDLICWAGAIPVTIAYKIAKGKSPFSDNDQTKTLTSATSFKALAKQFPNSSSTLAGAGVMGEAFLVQDDREHKTDGLVPISESTAAVVFEICHAIAGITGVFSAFFDSLEASEEDADNDLVYPAAISAIVGGGLQVGCNILVPKDPIKSTVVNVLNMATSGIRVVCKAIFCGPGQDFLEGKAKLGKLKVENARGVGSIVDAILTLPALACSCWHFYELANTDSDKEQVEAILDETSNVAAYAARVSYAVAVNTEAEVKAVAIGVLIIADLAYGGLQIAETIVEA